ncbi:hypothetical protein MRX96_000579 [Rhipicephalus microplus]
MTKNENDKGIIGAQDESSPISKLSRAHVYKTSHGLHAGHDPHFNFARTTQHAAHYHRNDEKGSAQKQVHRTGVEGRPMVADDSEGTQEQHDGTRDGEERRADGYGRFRSAEHHRRRRLSVQSFDPRQDWCGDAAVPYRLGNLREKLLLLR